MQSLLTVGSILHFAKDGDIIWGSGRNGRTVKGKHRFTNLDVRMVRGPLTHKFLREMGVHTPELYGDPGLLVGHFFPELYRRKSSKIHEVTVIPNMNDPLPLARGLKITKPTGPIMKVLDDISLSKMVISSSLHGIIVAEALGIPVRVLRSSTEPDFKYEDYFRGTGRDNFPAYDTVEQAMLGKSPCPCVFSVSQIIESFPFDSFDCGARAS
jgi:pyruvyltransferase